MLTVSTDGGACTPGKRRRSGPESGVLKKRAKLDEQPAPPAKEGAKRRRPRTKALRENLKNQIEKALKLKPSPIAHLFKELNSEGIPHAPLLDILQSLNIPASTISSLRPQAVEAISNLTTVFSIDRYGPDRTLMVSCIPVKDETEECTVYIDNLPDGCNVPKLERLLRKFGTVVEVRVPKTHSRCVKLPSGPLELGKRPKSFAFVQFTEKEAAANMIQAYEMNLLAPMGSVRRKSSSCLADLRLRIKLLSARRRRRTRPDAALLSRLRMVLSVILRKERALRKKARKSVVDQKGEKKDESNCDKRNMTEEKTSTHVTFSPNKLPSQPNGLNTSSCGKTLDVSNISMSQSVAKPRKRKRSRRRRVLDPAYIHSSVSTYFANIQVLPFERYRELRKEYLTQQRQSKNALKRRIRSESNDNRLPKNLDKWVLDYRDKNWSVKSEENGQWKADPC